jgi:tripartite-type tricarboxylate transporter receptor subunit TctC
MLFMAAIETDMTTVPYRGTAPAMTDLRAGQVDILCDQSTNTILVIKSGEVKALALTTPKRLADLADLATMAEQGLPSASVAAWHRMYLSKGTPRSFVRTLAFTIDEAALYMVAESKVVKEELLYPISQFYKIGSWHSKIQNKQFM